MNAKLLKIYRFILLYGVERTIVKTASRVMKYQMKYLLPKSFILQAKRTVSLIGCGQFGFATISYFVLKLKGKVFLDCYDLNNERSKFLGKFYGYNSQEDLEKVFTNPACKLIYIASNHATHTAYAIKALENKKDVYIEKPISVTQEQYAKLSKAMEGSSNRVFTGYNRPFSRSMRKITSMIENNKKPISLNCFVSAHTISDDHWYRNPEEGTRICGNVAHWIDLMIHIMQKRGEIPTEFEVTILHADKNDTNDNLTLSIRTPMNDISSIFITSRTEPMEGVNETINLQCGDVIAKIDDFKKLTIWQGDYKYDRKFLRKDVGHKRAVSQPFLEEKYLRQWKEIETSSWLILEITEMVNKGIYNKVLVK